MSASTVPPLPVSSVLSVVSGSGSSPFAVATLSKSPPAGTVAVTLMVVSVFEAMLAIVHGSATQAPVTLVMERFVGVSVTSTFVAVDGPALATSREYVTVLPIEYGPEEVNDFTMETSADGPAVPLLPASSVLSVVSGSGSTASTVATLSKAPSALMVAVTLMTVSAPVARLGMVQGKPEQPLPVTLVMERFDGVSVTWMEVAVEGPALWMVSEYVKVSPTT